MYPSTKRALLKRVQRISLKGAGWIIRLTYRLLYHGKYPDFKADNIRLTCSMPGISRCIISSPTKETDARAKADGDALMDKIKADSGAFDLQSGSLEAAVLLHHRQRPSLGDVKQPFDFRPEDIWQPPKA